MDSLFPPDRAPDEPDGPSATHDAPHPTTGGVATDQEQRRRALEADAKSDLVSNPGEKLLIARVRVADRLSTVFALDPASTDPIAVWLAQQPEFDDLPLRLFLDLASSSKTVLDVGAHIGTFSLPAATLGCKVIAVEGSPENARLLGIARGLNGFDNLEVVNAAASDQSGVQTFTAHGPWGHVSINGALPEMPRVQVESVRLEDLLAKRGWNEVDLMKIDIEGYEQKAFRGMDGLLREKAVRNILFESNATMLENYGLSPQNLLDFVAAFGYRLYYVDRENPGSLVEVDELFVQPECVADFLAATEPVRLPNWRVSPPMRIAETLQRVLACSTDSNAGFRRYAAQLLVEGPEWIRGWPESRESLERLADDEDPEIRKLVGPALLPTAFNEVMKAPESGGQDEPQDQTDTRTDELDDEEWDLLPATIETYDSYRARVGVVPMIRNIRRHWGLIKLLVRRDLTLRYRRSFLGVWWTMLHPVLNVLVMWLVFSHLFQTGVTEVPYVIYLLSGIIVFGFFSQAVHNVGSSLMGGEAILMRVHVPPEVLSVSAALGTAMNTAILLVPMVALQFALGTGVAPTIPAALGILLIALLFAVGSGLIVASIAVRFPDALTLTTIGMQLMAFLTPTFYPLEAIPFPYRWVILGNPLTHFLRLFRASMYGGPLDSWRSWTVIVVLTVGSLILGTRFFARASRRAVVAL